MINWVNFLHLYQPPQQDEYIFHQVARESYFEIARFFDRFDGLKLTMNLSGSLLEQLIAYRYDSLLDDFRKAFDSGEMELVGSAMYHPILPLLSESEIERQILLDEKIKSAVFGAGYVRQGFYLPEMAYSRKVASVLEQMGFRWIILDEVACGGRIGVCDTGRVYVLDGSSLKVIFRDREVSNSFVPEKLNLLSSVLSQDKNIITATDGELYGHRHRDFYEETRRVFQDGRIRSWQATEFIDEYGAVAEKVDPVESCWESQESDIARGVPFPFWQDGGNEIQSGLWRLAGHVLALVEEKKSDRNYEVARSFADRAISSCHFWAASGKRSALWQDMIWNPDAIERGNGLLVRAARSLSEVDTAKRLEAEAMSRDISRLVWSWHWERFYRP